MFRVSWDGALTKTSAARPKIAFDQEAFHSVQLEE
jgi:hypothetical protein